MKSKKGARIMRANSWFEKLVEMKDNGNIHTTNESNAVNENVSNKNNVNE